MFTETEVVLNGLILFFLHITVTHDTVDLLKEKFTDRVISLRGYNLATESFFLWDSVKGKVYTNRPTSIEALRDGVHGVIEGTAAIFGDQFVDGKFYKEDMVLQA